MTADTSLDLEAGDRSPKTSAHDPPRLDDRLDHILRRLEELYASLDALSAGQAALIEAGDAQRLLGVLSERQAIITQLQQTNDEFSPFRQRWSELMSELELSRSEDFTRRVDAMSRTIEQIARRDEADRSALSARRAEVADRLGEVTKSRSAISAYGSSGSIRTAPRYQNREG